MDDFTIEAPEVPDVPEEPEIPEIPQEPEVPETPEEPDIPDVPEEPEDPRISEAPPEPADPELPEDPRIAASPEEPIIPESPDEPHITDIPEEPVIPETPEEPEISDPPENPNIRQPEDELRPEDLEPNSTYERNGYEYKTDDQGRPTLVSGDLKLEPGDRTHLQTEIGHMGLEDDEGGHLIGTRFDGPTDAFNLVPQNSNLNRGEWKSMENSWADALAEGKDVKVMVEPIYTNDSIRPDSFDVISQIDGELVYKSFENQASSNSVEEA
jgi:hypothetical protein